MKIINDYVLCTERSFFACPRPLIRTINDVCPLHGVLSSSLRYKIEKQAFRNSSELKKTCHRNAWRISLAVITALVLGERQTPSPYTLLSRLRCSHSSDPCEYCDTCR